MKKLIIGAASLTMASAMLMNAAVVIGPPTVDDPFGPAVGGLPAGPWSLCVPYTTDLSGGPSALYASANWTFSIWDGAFGPFSFVQIEGQHLVAHPGEALPGPISTLAVLFPVSLNAGGLSYGSVSHHLPGPGGGDDWMLTINVDSLAPVSASGAVYAWHTVPEPGAFGLVAGLGLIGFAAYRRSRA